ncbi:Nitroreductase NfnB, partial [Lachnellula suecica]
AAHTGLATALLTVAQVSEPNIPALPDAFKHYRTDLGKQVYNVGMGIARDDAAGRKAAVLRNWEFFGAPVVAIVCMDKALGLVDSMGVGMYLQTLLLGLTERGLQSCVEVSLAGYPEAVKKELEIGEELQVLCGVAIGYEDPNFKGNGLRIGREDVSVTTKWFEE